MREFGPAISPETYHRVLREVAELFEELPNRKEVYGDDVAMDELAHSVVLRSGDIVDEDGNKLKIAATEAIARPPFEWLYELSSDFGESEYFKHYLIRTDDVVLAQRKLLTVIDDDEAETILRDCAYARRLLQA